MPMKLRPLVNVPEELNGVHDQDGIRRRKIPSSTSQRSCTHNEPFLRLKSRDSST
jgi:hypothetical protein